MRILKDMRRCTGCTACLEVCPAQAITMQTNAQGFLYPVIDGTACVRCTSCQRKCPVFLSPPVSGKTVCIAASSRDAERPAGSSGSVLAMLAEQVLAEGGVVFGAAYDEHRHVRHRAAERVSELPELLGVKYAQSDPGLTFFQAELLLRQHRPVLFCGTPCQIAGLRKHLGYTFPTLLTVDVACRGVPSPKAWDAYLEYRRRQDAEAAPPTRAEFRRDHGGTAIYGYGSGAETTLSYSEDPYLQAFFRGMTIRPACSSCSFTGVERCSDITLGEYGGRPGTSLVLVHSALGMRYWNAVAPQCAAEQLPLRKAVSDNPALVRPPAAHPARDTLLPKLDRQSFSVVADCVAEARAREDAAAAPRPKPLPQRVRQLLHRTDRS